SNREEIQGSLSRFVKKREEPSLELEQEMINSLHRESRSRSEEYETLIKNITCNDLDIELIKSSI
ncbi:33267_t:CDS:1, partial [Racocetra persica]